MLAENHPEYMIILKTGETVSGEWLEISGQEVLLKREDHSYDLYLSPQIAQIYRLGERVIM